jgi:dienelactone hydrolase
LSSIPQMTDIPYSHGDTAFTGLRLQGTKNGGILLVHGGAGLDTHAREQAQRFAAHGFTVFACDMYGDGVAGDRERVVAAVTRLRDDPDLLVRRAVAGLEQLHVDGPVAAVGYCFGGMAALTLARSGIDLAAAVSIHGSLSPHGTATGVRAKILVCHGSADPHVPYTDVAAFAEEMNRVGADWRLIMYGGAQHGFTHRHALPGATPGVEYHEEADRRSFEATLAFLAES